MVGCTNSDRCSGSIGFDSDSFDGSVLHSETDIGRFDGFEFDNSGSEDMDSWDSAGFDGFDSFDDHFDENFGVDAADFDSDDTVDFAVHSDDFSALHSHSEPDSVSAALPPALSNTHSPSS